MTESDKKDHHMDHIMDMIEAKWNSLSQEEKILAIRDAVQSKSEQSIMIILAGIESYQFAVRNEARKGLGLIRTRISTLISNQEDREAYLKGIRISASVCFRIYSQIRPDRSQKENGYYFKLLLDFEGKGPYFAYMAIYNEIISLTAMEQLMGTFSDSMRLSLVDQYLQATPSVRLKFGHSFIRIVKSVKDRSAVIHFYSKLFDRQGDSDPFLDNISSELRDPGKIISIELQSTPEKKIQGLKALAVISPKISSNILMDHLTVETEKKLRSAVYEIIEQSSVGEYSDLFYPLWEIFSICDETEALAAFRALACTGAYPVYELFDRVRSMRPALIPLICQEISNLSRIYFIVIQDIAMNKERYRESNFDINLACILGIIKKRPERVIKLLKKYDNITNDEIREDITRFVHKAKELIDLEKDNIHLEFESIIQAVKQRYKQKAGFLGALFKDSIEKRIENLQEKKSNKPGHGYFVKETVKSANLASMQFVSPELFFYSCVFDECNLTGSVFTDSFFKETVFFNIDMRQAKFNTVNFDGSVFINVNADGAFFNRCSFQNAVFHNCNLNHTKLTDTPFINSIISKTAFKFANLAGSCFSYSKISMIDFLDSNIDQTDFSFVSARFCRFPNSSKAIMRTEGMDYNDRRFQLSEQDMPILNEQIVSDINMLIFSEFIHYGEQKFIKQNQFSLLTAYDIFSNRQAELFQIIPYLLHENIDFPLIENLDKKTPCGIYDFLPSLETINILYRYQKKNQIPVRRSHGHMIEGVFTIGSTGSIAQTSDSDIDYWICINEDQFTQKAIELLKQKLVKIEHMAKDMFKTKITFFLVDILKARNNDFGGSTSESSGSAQSRLLKEEFYRTMIHVAGKRPLWCVLPTSISVNYYVSILAAISEIPNLMRYIDLGDIHAIPTTEFYGASIWQMFKWLKSPFKSVIKMALLEKYILGYGREALLCNQYKDEWMNSAARLKPAQNDSYYILLSHLIHFYAKIHDQDTIALLLTCFFLKLGISKDSEIENTVFGLRKILLEQCMRVWGWNKSEIFEIGGFKNWQYTDMAALSGTIEKFMIRKYKAINTNFDQNYSGRSMISAEDRTVLGRKIYIEFSKQPDKISKVLLISKNGRHFQGLHLKFVKKYEKTGSWELINKKVKSHEILEEPLITANSIEEIGAWLINNELYNGDTIVSLIPNPTYVTYDDIRKLFKTMYEFFSPIIGSEIGFDRLLMKNRVMALFISVNFYTPRQQHKITEYVAIYINSWGEMFCKSYFSDQGFPSLEETKTEILKQLNIKKMPLNTAYYFSKGIAR